MSFSRLLLVASSSQKYIAGEGNDKLFIGPKVSPTNDNRDPYAGEVVLCFQLDDRKDEEKQKRISRVLGIQEEEKRCDGLVFYAKDKEVDNTICLVEMKSTNISKAVEQIIATRDRIKTLLLEECRNQCNREIQKIQWKACIYYNAHGSSPDAHTKALGRLKAARFDAETFILAHNDMGPFIRNEANAEKLSKRYKKSKQR